MSDYERYGIGKGKTETIIVSGVTDHGDLTGLLDDDHPQYALIDGTRDFTGTVGGIDPVAPTDFVTKQFLEDAIADASLSGVVVEDTNTTAIALQERRHTTTRSAFTTASRMTIDFDRLRNSGVTFEWNQVAIAGGAEVRLRNETDGNNIVPPQTVSTIGTKKVQVGSLPSGTKVVAVQHRRTSPPGRVTMEGAILFFG